MAETLLKLSLEVASPKDLLVRYYPNGKLGGLTVDGPLPGSLGNRCELVVRAAAPTQRHFTVRGQLAWVRHRNARGLKECYGVDFLAEDDVGRQRLISFANEEPAPAEARFDERICIDLAVKITHDGKARKETACDLSLGGAFVRTALPPPVGTPLELDGRLPLSLRRVRLKGRVAWVQLTGTARGMGIQFIFDDPGQIEGLRKLLSRVKRR